MHCSLPLSLQSVLAGCDLRNEVGSGAAVGRAGGQHQGVHLLAVLGVVDDRHDHHVVLRAGSRPRLLPLVPGDVSVDLLLVGAVEADVVAVEQ